ncbi:hypothetical protein O1611_g4605 [Lasiodiplodia mahajangana]|uniref:Uncharacterized protein n=1 Tax=Lasiodiplodia mahajangana TaxID=1108764 RepID=A0ACC2JNI2_9PEZI|nr:hypothetical protein O1611_g4605 [Lasiodiplodia mahajangana]
MTERPCRIFPGLAQDPRNNTLPWLGESIAASRGRYSPPPAANQHFPKLLRPGASLWSYGVGSIADCERLQLAAHRATPTVKHEQAESKLTHQQCNNNSDASLLSCGRSVPPALSLDFVDETREVINIYETNSQDAGSDIEGEGNETATARTASLSERPNDYSYAASPPAPNLPRSTDSENGDLGQIEWMLNLCFPNKEDPVAYSKATDCIHIQTSPSINPGDGGPNAAVHSSPPKYDGHIGFQALINAGHLLDYGSINSDSPMARDENLLAAIVILRFVEEVDGPFSPADPQSHLTGTRALLAARDRTRQLSKLWTAVFWVALRQEIFMALTHSRSVHPDLLIEDIVSLGGAPGCDCDYANRVIFQAALCVQYCFGEKEQQVFTWEELNDSLDRWYASRPWQFYPMSTDEDEDEFLPEPRFLSDAGVTGSQHYYLARLVLEAHNPTTPKLGPARKMHLEKIDREMKRLVRTICGIAKANPHSAPAHVAASVSIVIAGDRFTEKHEQVILYDILVKTGEELFWPTWSAYGILSSSRSHPPPSPSLRLAMYALHAATSLPAGKEKSPKTSSDIGQRHDLPMLTRPMRPALRNKPTNIRKDNSSLRKSIAHGMVSKRGLPKKPQSTPGNPSQETVVRILPLRSKHYDRAVSWFNRLRTLPLTGCVPHLRSPNAIERHEGLALKYPLGRYRLLSDHMPGQHNLPGVPPLTQHDLRALRRIITRDIAVLYDARIPYESKISVTHLLICRVYSRTLQGVVYKPWINNFDYDMSQDEDVSWPNLKQSVIKSVKAQFSVLEAFIELSNHPQRELPINLEPSAAIKVLNSYRPGLINRNLIIRGVSTYSAALGEHAIEDAVGHLYSLTKRTTLRCNLLAVFTTEERKTIEHVLRLADSAPAAERIRRGKFLAIQALLLAVHAILLVHSHAKAITSIRSENLVVLEDETADMYTGVEQFQLVTNARRRAVDAANAMDAIDVKIGDRLRGFLKRPIGDQRTFDLLKSIDKDLP